MVAEPGPFVVENEDDLFELLRLIDDQGDLVARGIQSVGVEFRGWPKRTGCVIALCGFQRLRQHHQNCKDKELEMVGKHDDKMAPMSSQPKADRHGGLASKSVNSAQPAKDQSQKTPDKSQQPPQTSPRRKV